MKYRRLKLFIKRQRAGVLIEMTLSVAVLLTVSFGILEVGQATREDYLIEDGLNTVARELNIPNQIIAQGTISYPENQSSDFCKAGDIAFDLRNEGKQIVCLNAFINDTADNIQTGSIDSTSDESLGIANFINFAQISNASMLNIIGLSPENYAVTTKPVTVSYENSKTETLLYMAVRRINNKNIPFVNVAMPVCAELMIKINVSNPTASDNGKSYFTNINDLEKVCG